MHSYFSYIKYIFSWYEISALTSNFLFCFYCKLYQLHRKELIYLLIKCSSRECIYQWEKHFRNQLIFYYLKTIQLEFYYTYLNSWFYVFVSKAFKCSYSCVYAKNNSNFKFKIYFAIFWVEIKHHLWLHQSKTI